MTARAVRKFKSLNNGGLETPTFVTPEELADAELLWIVSAQEQLVQEKDFKLQRGQFNLFRDEKGIWRCGGRLSNVEAPYSTEHSILLPTLGTLVISEAHNRGGDTD